MNRIKEKYKTAFEKRINGKGLFLFRIFFSIVLLAEVSGLKFYQHLMFDETPYIAVSDLNYNVLLTFWQITILCLLFGYKTRLSAVINFMMSSFFFMTLTSFEYHVFYTYQAIAFLFLFLPISRGLSIDNILIQLKYSGPYQQYKPDVSVNVWAYYLPILLGLGFVYADSMLFKLTSENIWLKGLGMWLPASMPQAVHINVSSILNQEYLMKFLGYLTMVFEGLFLFLFWFKRFRVILLIIGLGLHIGILLVFPIPLFALTAIGLYVLMIPVSCWTKKSTNKTEKIKFFYDAECPLCIRAKIILSSITPSNSVRFYSVQGYAKQEQLLNNISLSILFQDIHGIKNQKVYKGVSLYTQVFLSTWYLAPLGLLMMTPGIKQCSELVYGYVAKNRATERCTQDNCGYTPPALPNDVKQIKIFKGLSVGTLHKAGLISLITFVFFAQSLVSWRSPLIQREIANSSISIFSHLNTFLEKVAWKLHPITYGLMGFTSHPVFMDGHFNGYNHLITIANSKGEFLPILNEEGMAENLIYGANWVNFTFRVNGPRVNQEQLIKGLKNYLAFWLIKNQGKENINEEFIIKMKKVDLPMQWEEDFLNQMIARPWTDIGVIGWKEDVFYCEIANVETI